MLDEEDLINSSDDDCRWMGTERKDPDTKKTTIAR